VDGAKEEEGLGVVVFLGGEGIFGSGPEKTLSSSFENTRVGVVWVGVFEKKVLVPSPP